MSYPYLNSTQTLLFDPQSDSIDKGAIFSQCKKYRYALWRIWDNTKPLVMFIGLNPSTANDATDDPTIQSVTRLSKHNGYGGFYMMNCFPYISTDPDHLYDCSHSAENDKQLADVAAKCKDVVFAWGSFKVIKRLGVDYILAQRFPLALCISKTADGSPGHPLFKKGTINFIKFNQLKNEQ